MTHISTFTSIKPRSVELPRPRYGLALLRDMIRTYRIRRRFRMDLERMMECNPHMIDDIGLTGRQARAEIAKRFWEA
jgi:uncharacterized protein YjiS (DUF1127 family)